MLRGRGVEGGGSLQRDWIYRLWFVRCEKRRGG
jgi:hypothetical protein